MAAPKETVWGSIGSSYLKLGIYTTVKNTSSTKSTVSIEVWLATKYSVQDPSNDFYFDITSSNSAPTTRTTATPKDTIYTYHDTGSGWDASNQVLIYTTSKEYARAASDSTKYIHSKITKVYCSGNSNGTASVSASFKIPKAAYTVSYNANGGTGAPPAQTKTHGINITLSSTRPTRSGYTFQGWGTSTGDTSADYQPGNPYKTDANIALYAIWKANTYTISYNANGGTGAPSSQTKTHGVNLTISSTVPTKSGYAFKGWALTQSGSPYYQPGYICGRDQNLTLYAVWESTYTKPRITNISVDRCVDKDTLADDGTNIRVKFNWATDKTVSSIKIQWKVSTAATYPAANSKTVSASGTSGSITQTIGNGGISTESSYKVRITVSDDTGSSPMERTVNGMRMPIDILAQNNGIAFGKPANIANTAEFAYDTRFNGFSNFYGNSRSHGTAAFDGHVIGKVYGMHGLVAIPASSDLNNYLTPGCYSIETTNDAATVSNIPEKVAGRLFVYTSNGAYTTFNTDTSVSATWCSLCQEYHTFATPDKNNENRLPPIVYKRIVRESGGNITYGPWIRQNGEKILWSGGDGGLHMNADQSITLSEPISSQPTGITLVFSYIDVNDAVQNHSWHTFFVPKSTVDFDKGGGHTFFMGINAGFSVIGAKYLYITDSTIKGQTSNTASDTISGITFNNARFVLRRVIGM